MKPVAIVDGRRIEVEGVGYYDNKLHSVMVKPLYNTLYLDRDPVTVVWEDRYAPVIESLKKRIEAYEERMLELATEYIESEYPFPTEVRKEYNQLKDQVEGLTEALGITVELSDSKPELTFEKPTLNKTLEVI